MKPAPDRLSLETYPQAVEIAARFSDVDMFRHLNNVAIGQFYEEVRFAIVARLREVPPPDRGGRITVVNVDTAYLREARYPGLVTVATGLAQRARRSFVLGQALFQNGVCFSAADTTLVYVENGAPAALPPEFDEILGSLALPSALEAGG
jgi:acyl-CoA thioester hydrolase